MADTLEMNSQTNPSQDAHAQSAETSLARCDGGYEAWRLLFAAFVFEALLWGLSQTLRLFVN